MRLRFKGVFGVNRRFQRTKHHGFYFWMSLYETVHNDRTSWSVPRTTYLYISLYWPRRPLLQVWTEVNNWSLLEY